MSGVQKLLAGIVVGVLLVGVGAVDGAEAAAGGPGLSDPSVLVVHDGPLTVTEDGSVVENLEIRGTLRIRASDVTVRNVWVYTSSFWTVYVESGSAVFEHVEIGHSAHVGERGIGGDNVIGRYLNIHHVEDGIKLGSDVVYEDVWVHDLDSLSAAPHADAVQADGGTQNVVVRNSSLDSTGPLRNGNAAVILKSDQGPISNVSFAGNYLNGGNYVVYVRDGGYGMPSGISFTNNRIGPDRTYGLLSTDGTITWEGNVWDETGYPALPPGGTFVDDDGNIHEESIEAIAAEGITLGCNPPINDRYCPSYAVTRGQMAAFLNRAFDLAPSDVDYFTDDNGTTFEDDINTIAKAGITNGCNPPANDHFCPSGQVNRGQMAAFLNRTFRYPTATIDYFTDDDTSIFEADINAIAKAGITLGCNPPDNDKYCPSGIVPRDQMASFLARAMDP